MNNENQTFQQQIKSLSNQSHKWGTEIDYRIQLDNYGYTQQSYFLKKYFWDQCEGVDTDPLNLFKINKINLDLRFIKSFKKLDERNYSDNKYKTRLSAYVEFEQTRIIHDIKVYEYIKLYFCSDSGTLILGSLHCHRFDLENNENKTEVDADFIYKIGSIILEKISPKLKQCFKTFCIDFAKEEKIEATDLQI